MTYLPRTAMLLSLAAFLTSSAWAVDRVSCNSTLSVCSIPENNLVQLPFAAIAGDVILQEPASTSVSDVFRIFNNLVDTGGGTGLGNLAILYSTDDDIPLPAPSTYSANAVIVKEAASGSTSYSGNGTTYNLDTAAAVTKLIYTGATTADYHDPAQLSAVLTVLATGVPIPNVTVNFTLGSQNCSGITNASGVATCTLTPSQAAGNYTVLANFGGIFGAEAGTNASLPFTITKEQNTLSYTGDTVIANGGTAHLAGVLLEDGVTSIAGRTVTFTLGMGLTAQICVGTTDATGKAACTISPVSQPLGPGMVSDVFAGDSFYLAASATTRTMVFAFLTQGAFVVGDQSAAAPGTSQTFWGSQWSGSNALSGGPAPDDFKGFGATLASEPPKCGITWTTRPGNSSDPPGAIPPYMGVLVSPAVTKSGATISGAASKIVVIRTDAGYSSDPGHPGSGTVVAQFCQ